MKRLIAAEDVEKAKRLKEKLYIDNNTIITPQAIDIAKEFNVEIVYTDCIDDCKPNENHSCCKEDHLKQNNKNEVEPALDPEEIYNLLNIALKEGLVNEEDLKKLI